MIMVHVNLPGCMKPITMVNWSLLKYPQDFTSTRRMIVDITAKVMQNPRVLGAEDWTKKRKY